MAAMGLAYGWKSSTDLQAPRWILAAAAIVLLLHAGQVVYVGRSIYTARLDALRTELVKYDGQNVLLKETPALRDRLIMTWGTSYEAWLLSLREERPFQGYAVVPDVSTYRWAVDEGGRVIFTFSQPKLAELPAARFHGFLDRRYQIIE